MPQKNAWDREYKNPLFITKGEKPQGDSLRFFKFYREETGQAMSGLKILDLGSGTGRNAHYLAALENEVFGLEISPAAIQIAKKKTTSAQFIEQSIGEKYPFPDNFFDIVLDITSSNALTEKEREVYLHESFRVLKKGGYFFVRALNKDGDKNAKKLLAMFPGDERDTYHMPKSHLTERVFSREGFRMAYAGFFTILRLDKKSGYTRFDNQPFKRNYWIAYLKK
jgi:ubiquinone/menaquinone biosynthesis C-methylase UbiE